MEAEHLGALFVRGEIEHAFEKEKRALATWDKLAEMDEGSLITRKRWKMIAEAHEGETNWSKGVEYVKMWQHGIRVNYAPALTKGIDEEINENQGGVLEEEAADEDIEGPVTDEEHGVQSGTQADSDDSSNLLTSEELEMLLMEQLEGLEDFREEVEEEWDDEGSETDTVEDEGVEVDEAVNVDGTQK